MCILSLLVFSCQLWFLSIIRICPYPDKSIPICPDNRGYIVFNTYQELTKVSRQFTICKTRLYRCFQVLLRLAINEDFTCGAYLFILYNISWKTYIIYHIYIKYTNLLPSHFSRMYLMHSEWVLLFKQNCWSMKLYNIHKFEYKFYNIFY